MVQLIKLKYICYRSGAEINMHALWCNVFIVCQLAMLNFHSIMQALKKCSPYLNCYKQTEICNFVTHFVTKLSGEHILFWKTYHSHTFNQSIFCAVFHSVFQSSSPFRNTHTRCNVESTALDLLDKNWHGWPILGKFKLFLY